MIVIKSYLKRIAIDTDDSFVEDEEEKRPFIPQSDVIVNDLDPYYTILFLEKEFSKKDLGGIFKRENGKKYSSGYINSVKSGNKGVTAEFLAAIKEFIPNFEEEYAKFVDHVRNFAPVEEETEMMKKRINDQKEIAELAKSSEQPTSKFSNYLIAISGLNVAQIRHALDGTDPNEIKIDENGKKKIPAELIKKAVEVFGFPIDDFKQFRTSGTTSYTNQYIGDLKRKYTGTREASIITSRLKKNQDCD